MDWAELISTVGFPIVAVMACAFFIFKVWQDGQTQNQRREERDRQQIERLSGILAENSKALLMNSQVMEKISDKIDTIKETVDEVKQDVNEIKLRQNQNNNENEK